MKNSKGSGDNLTLTVPAGGVLGGQGIIIGTSLFVVAQASEPTAGKKFAGITREVVSLPKDGVTVFTEGDIVGWDKDTGLGEVVADGDAGKDLDIGIVVETVVAAKLTVEVLLTPRA